KCGSEDHKVLNRPKCPPGEAQRRLDQRFKKPQVAAVAVPDRSGEVKPKAVGAAVDMDEATVVPVLPTLECAINGLKATMLLDSGADQSVLSLTFLSRLETTGNFTSAVRHVYDLDRLGDRETPLMAAMKVVETKEKPPLSPEEVSLNPNEERACFPESNVSVGTADASPGHPTSAHTWTASFARVELSNQSTVAIPVEKDAIKVLTSSSTALAVPDELGGPEKPQLYPTLTLDSKTYLKNRWKVSQVNIDTNLKLNGQPVGKCKFDMPPQTVNAQYRRIENQIVFQAGILQAPYDAAKNFGGIGVVIGHEITHGFDNSNHNYDGDGNFNPWWSNATNTTFKTKAQCLSDQYAKFVVNSDLTGAVLGNISGQLALGEAIADNGGLKTSFRAYHEYLKKFPSQYTEETGDKLFYLSFAQVR
ncbi:hypothetical protein DYB26_008367, partial [Aphanomyces astaci]